MEKFPENGDFFLQQLAWRFQNGNSILIVVDPILGAREECSIPENIKNSLHGVGIFVWGQAIEGWQGPLPIWKEAHNIGLNGHVALQWNKIIANIKNIGICRMEPRDYLTWKGKMKADIIIVADIYLSFSKRSTLHPRLQFPTVFWKIGIPNKIIIFSWLVFHDKNLIWESLQKRQWQGPGIYPMCKCKAENNNHIFLQCKLTTQVGKNLSKFFGFRCIVHSSIKDSMEWWGTEKPS